MNHKQYMIRFLNIRAKQNKQREWDLSRPETLAEIHTYRGIGIGLIRSLREQGVAVPRGPLDDPPQPVDPLIFGSVKVCVNP